MKVRTRKLLSLLLTLAMVAGMFVLPASATGTTHSIVGANTDSYFTNGSLIIDGGTQKATFSDLGQVSSSWRSEGATGTSKQGRYIYFKKTAGATVKLWWFGKEAPVITTAADSITTGLIEDNENEQNYSSNTAVINTYTIANAGTYYISFTAAARLYKIEVTEEDSNAPKYAITKGETTNGSFMVKVGDDEVTEAAENATVTVAATPAEGYKVSAVTYTPDGGEAAATTKKDANTYTFAMPAADVTVNVTFEAGHEATPKTYKLSDTMSKMGSVYSDQDPLLLGPVYNSGYFSFTGDSADGLKYRSGPYLEIGKAEANNGITFTTNSESTVTVTVGSGNSAKYAVVALKAADGTMQVITTGTKGTGSNKGDDMILLNGTDCSATGVAGSDAKAALYKGTSKDAKVEWANLPAGTYTVYSPAVTKFTTIDTTPDNDPAGRGGRIYELVVAETDGVDVPDIEDKEITEVTVTPDTLALKKDETANLEFEVKPVDALNRQVEWKSSNTSVATVKVEKGKVVVTAVGGGTAEIIATSVKTGTVSGKCTVTVTAPLKKMTCALHENSPFLASKVYDGQPYTVEAKVKDVETGEEISDATFTYAATENGTYGDTVPSLTDVGETTFWFKAEAPGYAPYKSTEGHRITITKANPAVTFTASNNLIQGETAAKRTLTLTLTKPAAVEVDKVTYQITGDTTVYEVDAEAKQADGTYKIVFDDPAETIEYKFFVTTKSTNNYNAGSAATGFVKVAPSTATLPTHKLTYDVTKIKVTLKREGDTAAAVTEGAGIVAEPIVPEGQEFKEWKATGKELTAEQKVAPELNFAMPKNDVTLEVVFQDKTEPTEPVTKAALYDLLRNAEAYAEFPVVDTKAENVDKGEKWVTATDKKTFTDAIDDAQKVSSNPKATQAQVDKAVADLAEAWDAFTATFKDGTKSSGSSEPVKTTATLNCAEVETLNDKDPLTSADVKAKGSCFDVIGTVTKRQSTGKTVARGFELAKNGGGAITITVPEGGTANILAVLSGDDTKSVTVELLNGTTVVAYEGTQYDKLPKANTDVKWNNLPAGTYSMQATTKEGDVATVLTVRSINVETTTTGGDTSVVPDTADRTALKEAIKAAKENMDSVKTSTDGSDVSTSEQWVAERAKTAYAKAIELAEAKANSARYDDEALKAAKAALDAVTTEFNAAKRDGTKSSGSSSGGGSSSNVPSTTGGSTVKNEDGSKTTTKTNSSTGAVTETTTWPNGDKKVVVTEKDGTKTETVTKKDGSKTETVTKPDGSTTTAVTDAKGIKTETAVSASGETSAKVTLPKNVDKTVVTIPVKDATEGTVAVIVDSKGNETVIKTAVADETGLKLLVTGNVSVKIKDNAKKFVDIADDYWAKGAVDFVSSREIFKGVYETVFAPADLVNRGMMATVLYRLADAKAEGDNAFFDVPAGTWYTDAVIWANRSGVVTGYADGTFGPADAVTREQMATMLFRYAKAMKMDISAKGDMSKFGDANDVSSWASEAMTWAVGVGLINGVADPATGVTLSPAKTATRAEVATIMQRMVKLMMQ